MEPFATVDDLAAAWLGYDRDKEGAAKAALSFISAALRTMCDTANIDNDILKGITCRVAIRMLKAGDGVGVSQESWTASPFGGSVHYANPTGDIYLTAFEKALLGISGGDMSVTWVMLGGDSDV